MTNESGAVSWTGAYYPFGEMITGAGNVHGFTGKELDSEMGLNYFCLRYYDSEIGRFMTLDPFSGYIELPQTQNRYAYCINNPLKYIDPLGLDNIPIEYPYGFLRRSRFVHPGGLYSGLVGYAGQKGLWTMGVQSGITIDILESANPPGLTDQMRESAAATPPDPYLGGWIRGLLYGLSYALDLGSFLHRTIRPLLPSPPEPPPQPKPSPAPKQKSSPKIQKSSWPPPPYNKFNRFPWDDGWNFNDWWNKMYEIFPFDPQSPPEPPPPPPYEPDPPGPAS